MLPGPDPIAAAKAEDQKPGEEKAPRPEPEITTMDMNAFVELLDMLIYNCKRAEHDQLKESGYWSTWTICLGLTAAIAGALGGITAVTNSGIVIAGMLAVLAGLTGAPTHS